jgi:hypothetical protein
MGNAMPYFSKNIPALGFIADDYYATTPNSSHTKSKGMLHYVSRTSAPLLTAHSRTALPTCRCMRTRRRRLKAYTAMSASSPPSKHTQISVPCFPTATKCGTMTLGMRLTEILIE